MDEPTNGLDIPSKSIFRRVIASATDHCHTIIISTHQVRDLDQLIDQIIILDESTILLNASITEITDKLYFTHLDATAPAIYAETTVHGRWGVQLNTQKLESQMDMEILFNAAISDRQIFKNTFTNEK